MYNKKEKRVIILNNPIESTESDLFGINIYVDSIEQDDKEMLEDMVLVAVNNAIENMEKDKKEKLGKYSNMLNGLM